ncbi:MAG TPA: AMP-binding protein [Polyangiaceae bacterium]|nr:AMP-binding protein [Polyangiaceae bacterium]
MSTLSVLDAAREVPSQLALTDGSFELCFAELAERVRERMRRLAPLLEGDPSSRLVAVATDESRATIETLLALMELSIPFFPLHQRTTPAERDAALASLPLAWSIDLDGADELRLERLASHDSEQARRLLSAAPHLAALATSGSTGRPRVALLARAAFLASARASADHLGWRADDRWLLCLPLAHIGGLSVVTRCLVARKPVVMLPGRSTASSSERLAEAIVHGAPTLISLVPAQLDGLLELEPRFVLPRAVRVILTGGAAASQRLLAAAAERGWPILTSYGLTEACSQVATQRPGTAYDERRGVGVPLPGIEVRIEAGVIHIAGPTLASGYIGAGVDETFDAVRGYRTRDLGRLDAAGELHVLGRVDDLIISGGENVAPAEIEGVLQGCPGVLETCVFGVPDPRWGEAVVAGLRTRVDDTAGLIASAAAEARRRLAGFRRPKFYVCTREFAHGKNGKLDRAATVAALSRELERDPERWRAPAEERTRE